jgi:uncharacterized protein YegP (UPF0339 family)
MPGKIEFYEDHEHFWRWRLKAENGKVVAVGEQHRDRRDAERAFETMASIVMACVSYRVHEGEWPS